MASKVIIIVFYIFLSLGLHPSKGQNWVRAGYFWKQVYSDEFPISNINSSLFTHLICAFADVNSTTYELSFSSPSDELLFSNFTDTVKQKNPSVITLLSVGGATNYSILSSLLSNGSHRKSFIDSSIKIARLYGFQGLDLWPVEANTSSEMSNMGILFREWQAATVLEARNSKRPQLILTASVKYSPNYFHPARYPIDSIQQNLNWVHVVTVKYITPKTSNFTGPFAALYDPRSVNNTDKGIRAWIDGGLSPNKLVLCLPFYGNAWMLANPRDNGIGALATGPGSSEDGYMSYNYIKKNYIQPYGPKIMYNATFVVKYFAVGTTWIAFDDAEVVRVKISYAKEKGLLGYFVWQVYMDYNWELSQAAAHELEDEVQFPPPEDKKIGKTNTHKLVIILTTVATSILILGFLIYCCWMRKLKPKVDSAKQSKVEEAATALVLGDFNKNAPNLMVYTLVDIEMATDNFSFENKLGEGGFGPVYRGKSADGQEIAVKKLSKTSKQGYEEFKNEVMLTAKLQHINLVTLLGYCIYKEEKMLIYEYLPNKSLDTYLFDPIRRYNLGWKQRVHIIEGIIQGLIYLQEYSKVTIIHRDLKASNILLDGDMKPKISDFGMARIFGKDDFEANTGHIVGTLGYVSPEYVQKGIYSTKSDVYSFGVLLLQISSGKRISLLYGVNESLSLLDYAYELWKDGKGIEFMDPALDDTYSSCKLMKCLQIALLCVQENPNARPSMLEVLSMLKNETTNTMIPKRPAFLKQNDGHEGKKSLVQLEGCSGSTLSINDVTISEIVAR